MKHYDLSAWVDFARGFSSESMRPDLEKHLEECPGCRRTVNRLRVLSAIARHETLCAIAPRALELARSLGSRPTKRPWQPSLIIARLLIDTLQASQMAGVRGEVESGNRQLLYQAGDYSVDVRFEQEAHHPTMTLVGQVANMRAPAEKLFDLPVAVLSLSAIRARTVTNGHGEFQMELVPEPFLKLHIHLSDEKTIEASFDGEESRASNLEA